MRSEDENWTRSSRRVERKGENVWWDEQKPTIVRLCGASLRKCAPREKRSAEEVPHNSFRDRAAAAQLRGRAAAAHVRASRCLGWKVRSARDRTKRTIQIRVRWKFLQNSVIFARRFKTFENFQHFPKYRRNSERSSPTSEQKSMKIIKYNEILQN